MSNEEVQNGSDDFTKKANHIRQQVQNLMSGSLITIMLNNHNKLEYITGRYISLTETFILVEMKSNTANKPGDKDVVGVPFGSMKYVKFDSLKALVDG